MQTYIIYVSLLVFVVLFSNQAQRTKNKTYLWLIVLSLTFIAGCRAVTVGKDTANYVRIFSHLGKNMWAWDNLEIGFRFFSYAFLEIFNDYTLLLLFYAFVTNALIILRLWDFRKISSFPWMVACYYLSFYFMTMNIMRNFFAISIVFYATRYLERKSYLRFLCFVGVASLFHKSSLLGIVFIMLDVFQWRYLNRKQKVFIGAMFFLLPVVIYFIFQVMAGYGHYFETANISIGFMLITKLALYLFGLFLFYKIKPNKEEYNERIERDMYSIKSVKIYYPLGILLTSLGYIFSYMDRIGLPFYLFECVYFGMLVKITKGKQIFRIVLSLLLLYIFLTELISNGQGVLPYVFIWQDL